METKVYKRVVKTEQYEKVSHWCYDHDAKILYIWHNIEDWASTNRDYISYEIQFKNEDDAIAFTLTFGI